MYRPKYIYIIYFFINNQFSSFLYISLYSCTFQAAKDANEGIINDIKNKELNKNNDEIKEKKNINEEKTSKLNKRGRNVYENIDPRYLCVCVYISCIYKYYIYLYVYIHKYIHTYIYTYIYVYGS
jgi:hypothetical protein